VANTLNLFRQEAVGFIDWLDDFSLCTLYKISMLCCWPLLGNLSARAPNRDSHEARTLYSPDELGFFGRPYAIDEKLGILVGYNDR
jgi:hypothetical protein